MLDKNKTIILMDLNSIEGKIVRLIVNRNCEPKDGYHIEQHCSESTYFPGNDDKKFVLIGNIFNDKFKADIYNKDITYKNYLKFTEHSVLATLSTLWTETKNGNVSIMTQEEASLLTSLSMVIEKKETPSTKVMRTYLENFVTILTSGKEFFSKDFKEIEDTVKWYNNKDKPGYSTSGVSAVEQHILDEKKFFEPNTYQIVLDFKGKDLEEVLLDFYKKYPDLKQYFNLISEVKEGVDISSIMEQKLLLESLHLANVEYYNQHIKKSEIKNVVNESILDEIKTTVNKIRNRIIVGWNKL